MQRQPDLRRRRDARRRPRPPDRRRRRPAGGGGALLADADYRIANLECSVSTRGASLPGKPYTFRADPRAPRDAGRFDAVAVSNNHSGDFGPDAFLDTIDHLRAGIRSFGGGRNLPDAHAPLWIHKNGLRIAVLGYNEYKPRSFEAGASRPAWPGARTAR
jgi:poly-gamma-glutamate synthesis protein (capsule biosynthesis protein)